jgi:Spy/CpxP family protein refolding chaperone
MKDSTELRQQLTQKKKELATIIENGASEAKMKECNSQIHEVQKKLSLLHSEMLIEISKILTPEQRSKFSRRMMESQYVNDLQFPLNFDLQCA